MKKMSEEEWEFLKDKNISELKEHINLSTNLLLKKEKEWKNKAMIFDLNVLKLKREYKTQESWDKAKEELLNSMEGDEDG